MFIHAYFTYGTGEMHLMMAISHEQLYVLTEQGLYVVLQQDLQV